MTMKKLLDKIEALLTEEAEGEDVQYLQEYKNRKGTTEDALSAFEKEFGIDLPEGMRQLFLLKDGSGYPFNLFYTSYSEDCLTAFYFLSLEEIRKVKTYFCNESKLMCDFPDFFTTEAIAKLDSRIRPYLFHKKWIPFAQVIGGSRYLMMDFDPAAGGKMGQIILYVHDPDFIYYIAPNAEGLLLDTIENLKDGWYEEFCYG